MSPESLQHFLGWCSVINYGILLVWFGFFAFAKSFVYTLHSKWFDIHQEEFDAIHYKSIASYKLLIFMFNLVPYLVLRFF